MICHHYKCLFVHIPKNAGQSIEHIFLDALGLTWETHAPLLLRPNSVRELGPPRLAHLKIHEYLKYKYVSQEMFSDYFKFSFIRNPWDRFVSIYKNHYYQGPFKKFLFSVFYKKIWEKDYWFVGPQYEFISDENANVCVDFLGRFENIEDDFSKVRQKIGLSLNNLPHKNRSANRGLRSRLRSFCGAVISWDIYEASSLFGKKEWFENYMEYYDDECIEFVAELYKEDIEHFQYKFGN